MSDPSHVESLTSFIFLDFPVTSLDHKQFVGVTEYDYDNDQVHKIYVEVSFEG